MTELGPQGVSGPCTEGFAELTVPSGAEFDYVVAMEDLVHGQRFGNYSVEYQAVGSSEWETLVSASNVTDTPAPTRAPHEPKRRGGLGDRPDGNDPRDSHIGHKRIDLPEVRTAGAGAIKVAKVRLNCLRAIEEPVHIRSFSLHKKTVPWESTALGEY